MQSQTHMDDIDYAALGKATKALCVLFIILICTINALLIYMVTRKPRFVSSPWCLVMISLALGDIFLALFSLVVNARLSYEQVSLPFATNLTAEYYQTFVINFVYGLGLIVMTVELILRHKRLTPFLKRYPTVEAFGFSALPWLLMLVIDLPLISSDVEWDDAAVEATQVRSRAKYWVSVLVPAILAVVMSLVITFLKLEPAPRSNEPHFSNAYTPEVGQNLSRRNFLTTRHEMGSLSSNNSHRVSQPPHHTLNNHPTTQNISSSEHPSDDHNDVTFRIPTFSTHNPVSEKCALLLVAVIYFMCVVPQATLFVSDSEVSVRIFLILLNSFYWKYS